MEIGQALSGPGPHNPLDTFCPRCGESQGTLPAVETATLERRLVRRCRRCGSRYSNFEGKVEYVFTCGRCSLPFATEICLPHSEHRCADCREGRPPENLPDGSLAEAMETEVRAVLSERWTFVGARDLDPYLDRLARRIAENMEGVPAGAKVVLLRDDALRSLALPSGLVVLSVGYLDFLEDEAELAFVLAHELAHAATGEAATRLVRLGYHAATREQDTPAAEAWTEAVLDLVRLGYGRHRERDADRRAVDAMMSAGYEPEAAVRVLRRLGGLVMRSDPRVSEEAAAHPPADDRIRRIEKYLFRHWSRDRTVRLNREVYRRAAGPRARAATLEAVSLEARDGAGEAERPRRKLARIAAWGAGILLLAAAILTVGLLLAGS